MAEARGNAFLTPAWFRAWATSRSGDRQPMIVAVRRQDGERPPVYSRWCSMRAPTLARCASAAPASATASVSPHRPKTRTPSLSPRSRRSSPGPQPGRSWCSTESMLAAAGPPRWRGARGVGWRSSNRATLSFPIPSLPVSTGTGTSPPAARSSASESRVAWNEPLTATASRTGSGRRRPGVPRRRHGILFRLHDLRKTEGESSISSLEVRESLTAFAREALARGWLRLRNTWTNGQHAAAILAWRIGPSYGIYQTGFDPVWAEHSAGMLLFKGHRTKRDLRGCRGCRLPAGIRVLQVALRPRGTSRPNAGAGKGLAARSPARLSGGRGAATWTGFDVTASAQARGPGFRAGPAGRADLACLTPSRGAR